MNRSESHHEGEHRKAEVLGLLAAHREVYVNRGRRGLLIAALRIGIANADDVRNAVELPDSIDPRCLGVVPGPLAKQRPR